MWLIAYLHPTYGLRTFRVWTAAELADDRAWLDSTGYPYTVTPLR